MVFASHSIFLSPQVSSTLIPVQDSPSTTQDILTHPMPSLPLTDTSGDQHELLEAASLILEEATQGLAKQDLASNSQMRQFTHQLDQEILRLQPLLSRLAQMSQALDDAQRAIRERMQRYQQVSRQFHLLLKDEGSTPQLSGLPLADADGNPQPKRRGRPPKIQGFSPVPQALPNIPTSFVDAVFLPEKAFQLGDSYFQDKQSISYHMFRAIVLNGGRATTDQIRRFLVDQGVSQPKKDGQGFEGVSATRISSQVNYLVRRGLVALTGNGQYVCRFGWVNSLEELSSSSEV